VSDTEVNALAVNRRGGRRVPVVTTVTPLAKWPSTRRKSSGPITLLFYQVSADFSTCARAWTSLADCYALTVLGVPPIMTPHGEAMSAQGNPAVTEAEVLEALRSVKDPAGGRTWSPLGLVRDLHVGPGEVSFTLAFAGQSPQSKVALHSGASCGGQHSRGRPR
jgi:hypothetical protein